MQIIYMYFCFELSILNYLNFSESMGNDMIYENKHLVLI